jgi:hypothetical protein
MSDTELLQRIADDVAVLKEKLSHMDSLLEEMVHPRREHKTDGSISGEETAEERVEKTKAMTFRDMYEFLENGE